MEDRINAVEGNRKMILKCLQKMAKILVGLDINFDSEWILLSIQ